MPHITVEMYKGRTKEVKQKMTENLVKALEDCGVSSDVISVEIIDVDKENWQKQVAERSIREDNENIFKMPG